jgi:hypothetical protein
MERGSRVVCEKCGQKEMNKAKGKGHRHPANVLAIICAMCCQPVGTKVVRARPPSPRFQRGLV